MIHACATGHLILHLCRPTCVYNWLYFRKYLAWFSLQPTLFSFFVNNSLFIWKQSWGVVFVFWIVSVPALNEMFRAYPRVVVWRPFVSIHSFDPSSPFPLILRKTKETNAFRFRRCIKLIVAFIHTTSFHHICSHCILCKQDALSTRKYLCACARFRSAVTLKEPMTFIAKGNDCHRMWNSKH